MYVFLAFLVCGLVADFFGNCQSQWMENVMLGTGASGSRLNKPVAKSETGLVAQVTEQVQ